MMQVPKLIIAYRPIKVENCYKTDRGTILLGLESLALL